MHRKGEKKHNRSGLQVMMVQVSSIIYGCLLPSWFVVNNEKKCGGVISICDNTSVELKAGCQYPLRMVSLTPVKLCQ